MPTTVRSRTKISLGREDPHDLRDLGEKFRPVESFWYVKLTAEFAARLNGRLTLL
jgi:hypothetical protein